MTSIVCSACGTTTPRTGRRQSYCPDCRKSRDRQQRAEAEARYRERHGERIRERDRERYATNPSVAAVKKAAAKGFYEQVRADPARYETRLERGRIAGRSFLDRHMYGGNRIVALLKG